MFYFTHWLYVPFFILLVLHAAVFWKWFVGPLAIILLERVYKLYRVRSDMYGETYIRDVNLLNSKVGFKIKFFVRSNKSIFTFDYLIYYR